VANNYWIWLSTPEKTTPSGTAVWSSDWYETVRDTGSPLGCPLLTPQGSYPVFNFVEVDPKRESIDFARVIDTDYRTQVGFKNVSSEHPIQEFEPLRMI
jgi:hypothetical protein